MEKVQEGPKQPLYQLVIQWQPGGQFAIAWPNADLMVKAAMLEGARIALTLETVKAQSSPIVMPTGVKLA